MSTGYPDIELTHPAVGRPIADIATPALLVDLDLLERNIAAMASFFRDRPARLRPHAKTHRAPAVARMQVEAGAVGVTCAKVSMAEAMVDGGVSDVYVANQVVAAHAIERLVTLARRARVTVAVDQAANVRDLSRAATAHGVTLYVRIEVDAGMGRAGVRPGLDALELAQVVHRSPGLEFEGLHAYEGHVVSAADRAYRELHTRQMLALIMDTRDRIAASGIPCPVVTCGGTGTYDISGIYPGVTEHQAGSYVYMDPGYHRTVPAFGLALTVLGTVTSRPTADRVITDAGLQALGGDAGPGEPKGIPGLVSEELSEEHGTLRIASGSPKGLRVGDRLELYPGHCDSVVNLHDRVYAVRNARVEAVWRVTARGCSQ